MITVFVFASALVTKNKALCHCITKTFRLSFEVSSFYKVNIMVTGLFILQLTGSDRSLMNAFREIGVMADRINLPRKIQVSNLDIIEYNN